MASLTAGIQEFFSWWGQELSDLVPSWILGNPGPLVPYFLSVEEKGLRLVDARNAKAAGEKGAQEEPAPVPKMIEKLAEMHKAKRLSSVGLRLPYKACFARRVELPAAASSNFGRLLAFDLDRATPFKAKDVFTAHYSERAEASPGKVWVRQLVIKRSAIETLKNSIEELGIAVPVADCWNEDGSAPLPINFLAGDADAMASSRGGSLGVQLLGAVAAMLVVSATYILFDKRQTALQELQAQTSRLKVRAQEVRDSMARSQAAFSEISNLHRLRSESVSKVYVIEELTRILPDTAYVTDLKIEGNTVDVSGLAASAAALIPTLERSALFYGATSTAPLTFDPQQNKERFSIRVQVRPGTNADNAKLEEKK